MYSKKFIKNIEAKNFIENQFEVFYSNLGYQREPSVAITSRIDPTVRFIGSHISVLKPYLRKVVPEQGIFIKQNCVRTWNANRLLEDSFYPKWGSYFTSIGTLTPPNIEESFNRTIEFLTKSLEMPLEKIVLNVSSNDQDLLSICKKYYPNKLIRIDTKEKKYYRHQIGEEGIRGRNFNIAISNSKTGEYSDIGNFIILEDAQIKRGIEVALGTSTIIKEVFNLNHVLDCYDLNPFILNISERVKFLDSLITSSVLLNEGLNPVSSNNRGRILKIYLRALNYYVRKYSMGVEELGRLINKFTIEENLDEELSKKLFTILDKK